MIFKEFLVHYTKRMKATLKFLKDFYSPLHKKTFVAASEKNSIEIDVDVDGVALHSFWRGQLQDSPEYFELILLSSEKQPKKTK